jgi:hypothetical protein
MSDDLVDCTVSSAPPSVLDELIAIRECACAEDERLRREGATQVTMVVSTGLETLDRLILELEDREAQIAILASVVADQARDCRRAWRIAAVNTGITIGVTALIWWVG